MVMLRRMRWILLVRMRCCVRMLSIRRTFTDYSLPYMPSLSEYGRMYPPAIFTRSLF